jgi:hypothetical protein
LRSTHGCISTTSDSASATQGKVKPASSSSDESSGPLDAVAHPAFGHPGNALAAVANAATAAQPDTLRQRRLQQCLALFHNHRAAKRLDAQRLAQVVLRCGASAQSGAQRHAQQALGTAEARNQLDRLAARDGVAGPGNEGAGARMR